MIHDAVQLTMDLIRVIAYMRTTSQACKDLSLQCQDVNTVLIQIPPVFSNHPTIVALSKVLQECLDYLNSIQGKGTVGLTMMIASEGFKKKIPKFKEDIQRCASLAQFNLTVSYSRMSTNDDRHKVPRLL
jgi:hypothetical protein